jgi:hypothetical protein
MPAPYDGGCLCGAVRYRLAAEPLTLYACHCTDCQRQTGAAFGLSMVVARDHLSLLQGEARSYRARMPDGREKQGRFCGACATRLWGEPPKYPEIFVLRPGTLDDTSWLAPVGHIWTRSAQPWVPIPDDTLNFQGQPGDRLALVRAWQERGARAKGSRGRAG